MKTLIIALLLVLSTGPVSPVEKRDWRFFYEEGLHHFNKERFDNALYYFQRARDKNPEHYIIYRAIGKCHQKLGKPYEAISAYEKSLRLKANQPDVLLYMGQFHSAKRSYDRAEKFLGAYYQLKKNNGPANLRYAVTMARNQKRSKAQQLLQAISRQDPTLLAECSRFEKTGQLKASYQCYRKYVLLNPADTSGFLALVRLEERQFIKPSSGSSLDFIGENWASDLFQLYGNQEEFAWPLFFQYYRSKQFRKADQVLQAIKKITGNKKLALLFEAEILREKNKSIQAEQFYKQAMNLN